MAKIESIGQIHISASDYDRALSFYRDTLALPLLFEVPGQKMAFFDCGGVRLYLAVPTSPEYAANSFLYYRTDNIQSMYNKLVERNVTFVNEPSMVHKDENHELWMAGFKDSEGNLAQLMEERAIK